MHTTFTKANIHLYLLEKYLQKIETYLQNAANLINSLPFITFFGLLGTMTLLGFTPLLSVSLSLYINFLIFNWDSRLITFIAILSLAYIPLSLSFNQDTLAHNLALASYTCLAATIILDLSNLIRQRIQDSLKTTRTASPPKTFSPDHQSSTSTKYYRLKTYSHLKTLSNTHTIQLQKITTQKIPLSIRPTHQYSQAA